MGMPKETDMKIQNNRVTRTRLVRTGVYNDNDGLNAV